jgi:hypothetical protein
MESHFIRSDAEQSHAEAMAHAGTARVFVPTDPADYTELGKLYRQRSIRAEIILLAYAPTRVFAIVIAYWV